MSGETLSATNRQSETEGPYDRNGSVPQALQLGSTPRAEWNFSAPPESVSPGERLEQPLVQLPARKAAFFKPALNLFCLCALAIGSYFGFSHYLVQSVRVVGTSMAPTLQDAQSYLLNRWIYYARGPKRSEIVVLRDPSDNGYSVKRVIAA